jgi:hypothetical protein
VWVPFVLARKLCLIDRGRRSKRRLDGERLSPLDVIEHEALALPRDARRTSRGIAR